MKDKLLELLESLHKKGFKFCDSGDGFVGVHEKTFINYDNNRFGIRDDEIYFEIPSISQVGDDILEIIPHSRIIVLDVRHGNNYHYGRIQIMNHPAYLNFNKDYGSMNENIQEKFDEKFLLTLVNILDDLYQSDQEIQ